MIPTYIASPDGGFITCLRCGKTSYNRHDVQQRYCGACHVFHDQLSEPERGVRPAAEGVHLVQCLCPQRHCIMALAYEHGASGTAPAERMLRDGLTPFATMADAAPFLILCQSMNLVAAKIYAELPKTN